MRRGRDGPDAVWQRADKSLPLTLHRKVTDQKMNIDRASGQGRKGAGTEQCSTVGGSIRWITSVRVIRPHMHVCHRGHPEVLLVNHLEVQQDQ